MTRRDNQIFKRTKSNIIKLFNAFLTSDRSFKNIQIQEGSYFINDFRPERGDAGPTTTLYLVYDTENEWPDKIKIDNSEDYLSKEELINIKKWFLKSEGPFDDELRGWALETLETEEYYKENKIVNYAGE